jgi:hypothetical protein
MPGTPKEATQTVKTAMGDGQSRTFTVDFGNVGAYAASSISLPATAGQTTPTDEMLEAMANGAVTQSKSTLVSKEPISLGQYQGLEVVAAMRGSSKTLLIMRIYWIPPNHACLLLVGGTSGGRLLEDRGTMFESLQIDEAR